MPNHTSHAPFRLGLVHHIVVMLDDAGSDALDPSNKSPCTEQGHEREPCDLLILAHHPLAWV